jgi:hypothetical protein
MTKRILDEVTKRKLAGMLPFSPGAFVVWTPEEFFSFPLDVQPKFSVRPLDKEHIAALRAAHQKGDYGIETQTKAIQYAVTHWADLIDLGTQFEIEFSQESFSLLPEPLVWLIYKKVNEMTFGLSAEEKEALELQQRPESGPLSKAAENVDSTQP